MSRDCMFTHMKMDDLPSNLPLCNGSLVRAPSIVTMVSVSGIALKVQDAVQGHQAIVKPSGEICHMGCILQEHLEGASVESYFLRVTTLVTRPGPSQSPHFSSTTRRTATRQRMFVLFW